MLLVAITLVVISAVSIAVILRQSWNRQKPEQIDRRVDAIMQQIQLGAVGSLKPKIDSDLENPEPDTPQDIGERSRRSLLAKDD